MLCEASFPKKLAFAYLEDLQAEFHEQHGKKVPTVSRPYSFIEFGEKKRERGTTELLLTCMIYLPLTAFNVSVAPSKTPTSRRPRSRT